MNLRQKFPLYFLLYITVCSGGLAQVIEIPDPNLRHAVREALNMPAGAPTTKADMGQLSQLNARDRRITDLTGLGYATNLTSLRLNGNQIEDISPLANLSHLKVVRLDHNNIVDISALANLTQLIELHLDGNRIESISPLANLTQLNFLRLDRNDIVEVSPLANLTQLTDLLLDGNRIENISPLANLTQLTKLHLSGNRIFDVSPLVYLTELTHLRLIHNDIVEVGPLSNLTQLTKLHLSDNRIFDVGPLASLTNLESLDIRRNPASDYSSLDGLTLTDFLYDEHCELSPLPVRNRIENKSNPAIFAAFGDGIENRPELSRTERRALHDLWLGSSFGLWYKDTNQGTKFAGALQDAMRQRDELLALNPNMVFLALVPYVALLSDAFPDDWPHWIRDAQGNRKPLSRHSDFIDFPHPEVQDMIVGMVLAVEQCGLYDGVIFDFGREDIHFLPGHRSHEEELVARENILQRIRAEARPDFLISTNVNVTRPRRTGPYINGLSMESSVPGPGGKENLEARLNAIEETLLWADNNLRKPQINHLEGQIIPTEPPDSPMNLRWMRVITTLSLTHSDGYLVFGSNVLTVDHYWYNFWDADLGRPLSEEKAQLYENREGLYIREYTNGWAVFNHSGSEQHITLPEEVQGVSSGMIGTEHMVANVDGEMYLKIKPKNPADVNRDGVVNILDLVMVAQGLGTDNPETDVNKDGLVNILDLVQVAGALGGGGAAPSAYSLDPSIISAADVERWLALAQGSGIGDANFQRGIRFLQQLLAVLSPKETSLLPNYPNPFNPETWIPYRLAREAAVAITIYDTKGTLVRRLALGNQAAGYYAARGKAAYWDGRNERGEAVASGIYIYQFRAGDYVVSRRMIILK